MTYRMKTALLAATSLTFIAGGQSEAAEWDLQVGGYYNAMMAYASNDAATGNGVDDTDGLGIAFDSEIYVLPTITLDNGLKISARMDFEADNDGIGVDEPEIIVAGSFGSLVLGSADDADLGAGRNPSSLSPLDDPSSPDYLPSNRGYNETSFRGAMADLAYDIVPVQGDQSGVSRANPFGFGSSVISTTNPANDGLTEGRRITYFTPRFAGFQIGVSYANSDQPRAGCSTNACHLFDIGANYVGSFAGVDVSLGASYSVADTNDPAADPTLFRTRGEITLQNYSFGASFAEQNGSSGGGEYDGQSFGLGASYASGPWTFGIDYFHGEMNDYRHIGFGPRAQLSSAFVSVSYRADERTDLSVFLGHVSYREDVGDGGFGTPGDNIDAFVIGTGIGLSF